MAALSHRLILTLSLFPLGLASPLRAQAPSPAPPPVGTFPADVDLVTVDAIVLDGDGHPVEGLGREDFVVKEDGRPQALATFEAVRVPEPSSTDLRRSRVSQSAVPGALERTFILVFDDANLTALSAGHAREAASTFVRQGVRPGDTVMVVPTAGGSWWSGRIPEDRDSLLARIAAMEGRYRPATGPDRIWDHEAVAIWTGRDPQVLGMVVRRLFDNGVIADNSDPNQSLKNMDISPGLSIVRIRAQETYRAAIGRLKLTLGTLTRVAAALEAGRGRKEVLLVSEGFVMDTSQPEFRQLVQAARRSNSAIHFLDARGPGGMIGQAGMPGGGAEFGRSPSDQDATTVLALTSQAVEGARSIAIDTGGSVVPSTNGLGREMGRIAQESRAYYLLGYAPTNARRDGSFRRVTVDVTRPGRYEVRARRGYYASEAKDDRVVDKKDLLDPQVRAALDAPFTAALIPLRLTNYVTGGGASGKVPVLLLGEADVAGLRLEREGDRFRTALEAFFVVQPRGEGTPAQQEKLIEVAVPEAQLEVVRRSGIPLGAQLDLAPGVYQARLVVRERGTGRLGTVRHEFEVQAPTGLRLSSLILTDSFHAAKAGDLPRPVPVARRSFAAGARLGVAHELYGARTDPATGRPNLTSSYLVRSADGTAVATGPSHSLQAAGTESVAQAIVVMAPAEAGDYEFVLKVTDEVAGATVEAIEPFAVTR